MFVVRPRERKNPKRTIECHELSEYDLDKVQAGLPQMAFEEQKARMVSEFEATEKQSG